MNNISEQGDGKNIPLLRENKIYLYLKIDNSNVIILDNNSLIRGNDYFSHKISEKTLKITDKKWMKINLIRQFVRNNKHCILKIFLYL